MTTFRFAARAATLGTAALLAGCLATGSPAYDAQFGDAVRQLGAQQTANAQGAAARTGQDGRSAREAHDRYLESFTAPPTTTVVNIGIGGGK